MQRLFRISQIENPVHILACQYTRVDWVRVFICHPFLRGVKKGKPLTEEAEERPNGVFPR